MRDLSLSRPISLDALASSLDLEPIERDAAVADFTLRNLNSSGSSDGDSQNARKSGRSVSFGDALERSPPGLRALSNRGGVVPRLVRQVKILTPRRAQFDAYAVLPSAGLGRYASPDNEVPAPKVSRSHSLATHEVMNTYRKEENAFGEALQDERRRSEFEGEEEGSRNRFIGLFRRSRRI